MIVEYLKIYIEVKFDEIKASDVDDLHVLLIREFQEEMEKILNEVERE
jgi:hypothetical protein